jgi:hypothetical protein
MDPKKNPVFASVDQLTVLPERTSWPACFGLALERNSGFIVQQWKGFGAKFSAASMKNLSLFWTLATKKTQQISEKYDINKEAAFPWSANNEVKQKLVRHEGQEQNLATTSKCPKWLCSEAEAASLRFYFQDFCRHRVNGEFGSPLLQRIQIGQIMTTASNPEDNYTLGHRNIAPKNDFEAVFSAQIWKKSFFENWCPFKNWWKVALQHRAEEKSSQKWCTAFVLWKVIFEAVGGPNKTWILLKVVLSFLRAVKKLKDDDNFSRLLAAWRPWRFNLKLYQQF